MPSVLETLKERGFLLVGKRAEMRVVHLVEPRAGEACTPPHDPVANVLRQRVERGVRVRVHRVAVDRRQLERVDERAGVGEPPQVT